MGLKAQSIEIIMDDEIIDQDPHEKMLTLDPIVQVAKGIHPQKGLTQGDHPQAMCLQNTSLTKLEHD